MKTCGCCGCYIPDNWDNCPACKCSILNPLVRKALIRKTLSGDYIIDGGDNSTGIYHCYRDSKNDIIYYYDEAILKSAMDYINAPVMPTKMQR